jgi:hypothetical protein
MPAEWMTASTPASACDMFCARARSPITALALSSGIVLGRRSSTRRR